MMIHFVPDSHARGAAGALCRGDRPAGRPAPGAGAGRGHGRASPRRPPANENAVATLNGEAHKAWFDARSARAVAGSAAGLEAIAELNAEGGQAHPAAAELLARDIRVRLEELGAVLSL